MMADLFDIDELESGDVVEAAVNNTDCTISLFIEEIARCGGNCEWYVVSLRSIDGSMSWKYAMRDMERFRVWTDEAQEEAEAYLSRRSSKRDLTGIHKGSRSDAEAVYEAITNDIDVCSRIELAPNFLQTRSGSYHKLCRLGMSRCRCLITGETRCAPTPPPSPTHGAQSKKPDFQVLMDALHAVK